MDIFNALTILQKLIALIKDKCFFNLLARMEEYLSQASVYVPPDTTNPLIS